MEENKSDIQDTQFLEQNLHNSPEDIKTKKISYLDFLNWKNNLKKEDNLLDVGCWSGDTILNLKDRCNVWGMDIDKEKIDKIDSEIKEKIKLGDVTVNIPFKEKFDYILLSEVIEHVSDDEKALKNISNSLKKGGKLILTTPHSEKYFEIWDPAWIKWKLNIGPVHRHYSIKKIEEKLNSNNLKIQSYAVGWGLDFLWKRWINILLKYFIKSNKRLNYKMKDGFFDLCVIAEKVNN